MFEPRGTTNKGIPSIQKKDPQVIVFNTGHGGLGKMITSTAIAESIHKEYPDHVLNIVCPHPKVYDGCPYAVVYAAGPSTAGLYSKLSCNGQVSIKWLQADPYTDSAYANGEEHIIEAWHRMLNLNERSEPKLWLNKNEIDAVKNKIPEPYILTQISGGAVNKDDKGQIVRQRMWYREVSPQIMSYVMSSTQNEFNWVQVLKEGQEELNCLKLKDADIRDIFAAISRANIVVCIDSFVQHAAKALGKKAIVLWGSTRPQCLGYDSHVNLWRKACSTPLCNRPNSYLGDTMADGRPWECPFGSPCTDHDPENILEEIQNYKRGIS